MDIPNTKEISAFILDLDLPDFREPIPEYSEAR